MATGLRVIVTGATGNIGTSTMRTLCADPQVGSVVGISRRTPEWTDPKVEFVPLDVVEANADELDTLFEKADVVVHLAWLFQPTHDPYTTWQANVLGSIRVFEAVGRCGVGALVYASSVGAYSPGPKDRSVPESWPTHGWPDAAYTREKAYLERYLDYFEYAHPSTRLVRLRPCFVFKYQSASEQRRLFGGPFVPAGLVRSELLPALPELPGLRAQGMHAEDAGEAFRLASVKPVSGAFNLAAEPVLDARSLAETLNARPVRMPASMARAAVAAGWYAHVIPAAPGLFDAVLRLPLMDTSRARIDLGWAPRYSAIEAVEELLAGLRAGSGGDTPRLAPSSLRRRLGELASGVGSRP